MFRILFVNEHLVDKFTVCRCTFSIAMMWHVLGKCNTHTILLTDHLCPATSQNKPEEDFHRGSSSQGGGVRRTSWRGTERNQAHWQQRYFSSWHPTQTCKPTRTILYIFIEWGVCVCVNIYVFLGFNPQWNENFKFNVHVPELAMVRFVIEDYDSKSYNDFVAQYTLPFTSLQLGEYAFLRFPIKMFLKEERFIHLTSLPDIHLWRERQHLEKHIPMQEVSATCRQ